MRTIVSFVAILVMSAINHQLSAEEITLVRSDAAWSYRDVDAPTNDWTSIDFDASDWPVGQAPLGYGDDGKQTTLSFGDDENAKVPSAFFRRTFEVPPDLVSGGLTLALQCDDGAVVYINGREVLRLGMPNGDITNETFARRVVDGELEQQWERFDLGVDCLREGTNVIAVRVHQRDATSSDLSFNAQLTWHDGRAHIRRGPYLQTVTDEQAIVRWRTSLATISTLRWGRAGDDQPLGTRIGDAFMHDHEITIRNLQPETTYWYEIDAPGSSLIGPRRFEFVTNPVPGTQRSSRFWFIGDSGTANQDARDVYNAYRAFASDRPADLWFMLGDNAYDDGTDDEYQRAVFEMYPRMLATTCLWPCLGNHDGHSAWSSTESGVYYDLFTLPRAGEAGGVASGTEAYYSIDYGDVHFICLDSHHSDRSPDGAMAQWLKHDLSQTMARWVIVFFHHPPYTKGTHDSDNPEDSGRRLHDMRENILPILEAGGVDLVLSGHSHTYERSFLLDGHYGESHTLTPRMIVDDGDGRPESDGAYHTHADTSHDGTVYIVAGSSGKVGDGTLDHPAMFISMSTLGSVIVDTDEQTLKARFIDHKGNIGDWFVIRRIERAGQ